MTPSDDLTVEEVAVLADRDFFRKKAAITIKLKHALQQLHHRLQAELSSQSLLAPHDFNPEARQFVKGEHLEDFPYQYLDFPRFYTREEKLAFRSLVWWGHHIVYALIVDGPLVKDYRRNLFNRYSEIADRQLCLCVSPSLWEWKTGPGYTLDITHHHRSKIAAALDRRTYFKIQRVIPIDDRIVETEHLVREGVEAFRAVLPVVMS